MQPPSPLGRVEATWDGRPRCAWRAGSENPGLRRFGKRAQEDEQGANLRLGPRPGTRRGSGSLQSGNSSLAEQGIPKEKTVIICPPLCSSLPCKAWRALVALAEGQGELRWKPLGEQRREAGMEFAG